MLLANILKARGYPELAAQRFANIRMLRPDFKEAAASEAMARLQIGDLEPGWALWEQRPELDASLKDIPLWRGEKVATLWLYEDQGLGDAIQFLRYIPLLKDYVGQIRLHISSALRRLCSDNFPDIEIIETLPPMAEARYRLSSLPFFFKTRLHTIPAAPYIAASHQDRARLRAALSTLSPPRIGLVWAGNPRFRSDNIRSIPFAHLQPLLASGASHFVSLQKDRPGDQSLVAAYGMLDVGVEMRDFADTAAIIAELDLVISVDTATAHLAGALGKPVFILLPFESDWRWLLGRQDSPWYKSARLFRQKAPDDWTPVIDAVRQEVAKFIGGDRSVLHVTPTNGPCLRQHPDALPLPA